MQLICLKPVLYSAIFRENFSSIRPFSSSSPTCAQEEDETNMTARNKNPKTALRLKDVSVYSEKKKEKKVAMSDAILCFKFRPAKCI